ncbi:hypothetical protein LINPERHAP2_LOCUS9727, partial [Linum perenne]
INFFLLSIFSQISFHFQNFSSLISLSLLSICSQIRIVNLFSIPFSQSKLRAKQYQKKVGCTIHIIFCTDELH